MKKFAIIFLKYLSYFILCFVLLNLFNHGVPGFRNIGLNFELSLINTFVFGVVNFLINKKSLNFNRIVFVSFAVILILFVVLFVQEFSSFRGHWTEVSGKILEWHYNETGVFREEIVKITSYLYLFITIGFIKFKDLKKELKSVLLFFMGMYLILVTDFIIQPRPNYGEFSYYIIETTEGSSSVYTYRFFFIEFGKRR
ncbi:MAG: hypothetical protein ACE364_09365 [Chlorobiota bacterium]